MKAKSFMINQDHKTYTKQQKKEYKEYLNYLADKEFEKYIKCLNNAKQGIEENNKQKVEHWLIVAKMALKQTVSYRTRNI